MSRHERLIFYWEKLTLYLLLICCSVCLNDVCFIYTLKIVLCWTLWNNKQHCCQKLVITLMTSVSLSVISEHLHYYRKLHALKSGVEAGVLVLDWYFTLSKKCSRLFQKQRIITDFGGCSWKAKEFWPQVNEIFWEWNASGLFP